jgi:hypothetical protein
VNESDHGPTDVLSRHSPGGTEESHEKFTQQQSASRSRFDPRIFRNRGRNVTNSIDLKIMGCEHKGGSDLLRLLFWNSPADTGGTRTNPTLDNL